MVMVLDLDGDKEIDYCEFKKFCCWFKLIEFIRKVVDFEYYEELLV